MQHEENHVRKLALKMAGAGILMIVFSLLYAFLGPSPVDVLVDDYRNGTNYQERATSTETEEGQSLGSGDTNQESER